MADTGRLTKEEWDDLEPILSKADRVAHENFMSSPETKALLGDSDKSPGFILLQHLKKIGDEEAVKLLRAAEMYYHEITRADITAAYLRGKAAGRAEAVAANEE
jgi:5'-3' exonuclease